MTTAESPLAHSILNCAESVSGVGLSICAGDAARVPEMVARAFQTAMNGRPGPVVLALPENMLRERVTVADAPPARPVESMGDPRAIAELLGLLEQALRSLPDEIRSLNAADMRELEDFTREAIALVLSGQFPKEAYEAVGMGAAEIETVRKVRKQMAAPSEPALVGAAAHG